MIKLDRRRRRKPKNDEEEEEERTEVGFQQDLIVSVQIPVFIVTVGRISTTGL